MKERPILFSGPMVRALLAGTKTQTRRALRPQPPQECGIHYMLGNESWVAPEKRTPLRHTWEAWGGPLYDARPEKYLCGVHTVRCPYGAPGDRLWVRENGWERPERTPRMMLEGADTWAPYYYDADGEDAESLREQGFKRRPSIHMPRWACRLTLDVTAIRVERLDDITEKDARAEGILQVPGGWATDEGQPVSATARRAYEDLWHSINGAWLDCWVWVIEFKRCDVPSHDCCQEPKCR